MLDASVEGREAAIAKTFSRVSALASGVPLAEKDKGDSSVGISK